MNDALRELRVLLATRQGLGTLVVAVSAPVALGVVPNILQSWTSQVWLLYVAFTVAVAGVLVGWALTRNRGLGIVLTLYHTAPSDTRARAMLTAARSRHSTTLRLDRDELWPKDAALTMTNDQIHLLGRLLDARCAEHVDSGGSLTDIVLYPLISLQDGYRLGQTLRSPGSGLTIAHRSVATGEVFPGIRLDGALRNHAAAAPAFLQPPADPLLTANPAVGPGDPGYGHLALIIRLTGRSSMVDIARRVAETGSPDHPDGRPTGYHYASPACGATLAIEAAVTGVPEDSNSFATTVTYLRTQWQTAHTAWSTQTGSPTTGHLFFNGPLPIAIALGWALDDNTPALVPHDPSTR
ncbi:hypothetical protein E1265_23895 [Streptomyces sp. 8K308]|uniref:hypothetical protein n=1 Tax=Streptomyces sp. 8K308 TaxID=2530388 RepID=UPI001053FF30|nr:hypothetical protein [Streptomyces sp. 8K308]TDC19419.1 hypothetical protein E1265_23895 [Streptomyces sp. 8K308]